MASDETRWQQRVEGYRAEAVALFQANQAGRAAAERGLTLVLGASAVAVGAGVNADTALAACALAPVVLIVLSYVFQQYADVTVTGAARGILEDLLAEEIGARTLIYEYAVADVRKRSPLVSSVRLLQAVVASSTCAVVVAGGVAAFSSDVSWLVPAGYLLSVAIAGASTLLSYRAMTSAAVVAPREIRAKLTARGATGGAGGVPSDGGEESPRDGLG